MKNLDNIADELFNKVRGRFPNVTIGDEEGKVTNVPEDARFFDFEYKESQRALGKVSISIDDTSLSVMYSNDFVANEDAMTRDKWYNFLKELRVFSKKRMLNFDTRNITKSNLDRRDYNFLASNRTEEEQMTESTMYGTDKTSFQKFGNAKLSIKHSTPISVEENSRARSQKIGKIYIENAEGEKFKYPYKHLSGARAMATHVAEGGYPYDDFGKHIVSMSEELNKLRKFKTYMGRSSVMAESLAGYVDIVKERAVAIKKEISNLQKPGYYKEAVDGFETPVLEDVPSDVAENWIDQLTIKQFNEELQDVFPYIYNLVSEATKAQEVTLEELEEGPIDWAKGKIQDFKQGNARRMEQYKQDLHILRTVLSSNGMDKTMIDRLEQGCLNDPRVCLYNEIRKKNMQSGDMDMEVQRIGKELNSGWTTRSGTTDEHAIEDAFEEMMGQFGEGKSPHKKGTAKYKKHMAAMHAEDFDPEHFDGEFDGYATGDDGEEDGATIEYTATIVNGKPVVHPKSIRVHAHGNNPSSKLGNDVDMDTDMQDPEDMMQQCQDHANELWAKQQQAQGEGNAYSGAVAKAKMNGKKKGDKIDGPDGDEITLEKDEKTPLGEFILSYFDRESGKFPKGETAVLTMVEKDYGEKFITPAKQFIEMINSKVAEVMSQQTVQEPVIDEEPHGTVMEPTVDQDEQFGEGSGKNKATKEAQDIMRLAGL